MELFVREEEQFSEKGKLEVVHCLRPLLSHISGKPDSRHCGFVLKEILNPKGFVCQALPVTFVMLSALIHFCISQRA